MILSKWMRFIIDYDANIFNTKLILNTRYLSYNIRKVKKTKSYPHNCIAVKCMFWIHFFLEWCEIEFRSVNNASSKARSQNYEKGGFWKCFFNKCLNKIICFRWYSHLPTKTDVSNYQIWSSILSLWRRIFLQLFETWRSFFIIYTCCLIAILSKYHNYVFQNFKTR